MGKTKSINMNYPKASISEAITNFFHDIFSIFKYVKEISYLALWVIAVAKIPWLQQPVNFSWFCRGLLLFLVTTAYFSGLRQGRGQQKLYHESQDET